MRVSFLRSSLAEPASSSPRRRRPSKSPHRRQMPLELQSLEPRLALAVADTTAPAVKSITALKAGTYGTGSTISFKVTFTEKVFVTGTPTLPVQVKTIPITIGDEVRQATWNGKGNGGTSLVFTAPVQSLDLAPTGVAINGPIGLPGGAAIRDKAGTALIPTATGGFFPKVKVDGFGPSVTGFGAATVTPNRISLSVTFLEPVVVKGKPSIPFTLAGVSRQLVYQSGSGKNAMTFSYKPAKGEAPTDANVNVPTQAIALNGGAITDKVRNAAASLAKPTDVQLSGTSVPENQPSGTVVGTLSAVDADGSRDRHTYSLVAGAGSTDNASFSLVGNELRTFGSFDFETKSSYSVRVRATDFGGLVAEKVFAITVTNVVGFSGYFVLPAGRSYIVAPGDQLSALFVGQKVEFTPLAPVVGATVRRTVTAVSLSGGNTIATLSAAIDATTTAGTYIAGG